ncbi:MAG TPA: sigma-54 dependent transcriptional regulator [Tepidisphaeraceae bacterium]|jgi:DNA-binding NtrC family response regulator
MPARLLIVDDEPSICFALSRFFTERGDAAFTSPSAEDALAKLPRTRPDVIFLDIRLPGVSGLEAMQRFAEAETRNGDLPPAIIVMTAHGTMEAAIEAMRQGAYDYLVKPVSLDKAAHLVDRLMQSRAARGKKGREPFSPPAVDPLLMVGSSAPMQEVFKQIGAVAGRAMPVLILGETGSGKELVARATHAHGPRSAGPFVAINAAALPETLVESELFGFEKGAFTGADRRRAGRFEEADGGTLFLDEIGELPPAAQAKLLRFLDEPVITRLGGNDTRRLDVRLITATHRDLQELAAKDLFRPDLLYRLNVARIRVPPLRERREDIAALADHLLKQLNPEPRSLNPILAEETLHRLRQYDWPGNVRELRNVLQQALLVARDGVILPAHLPPLTMPLPGDDALSRRIAAGLEGAPQFAYDALMSPIEKEVLRQVMERHAGNLSRAADQLGLHRATLRTKLRQHGLADESGK